MICKDLLALPIAVAALCVLAAAAGLVEETHFGNVVSVSQGMLTLRESSGQELMFAVAADAKITRDGNEVDLQQLMRGDVASVTAESRGSQTVATVIEARSAF
jgi:hypothetical protein